MGGEDKLIVWIMLIGVALFNPLSLIIISSMFRGHLSKD